MNHGSHIVLCGACMAGNIGGPALYISLVEELQRLVPDVRVSVLSKYPRIDAGPCTQRGWFLYDWRTRKQLVRGLPTGMLAWLLRLLRLPWKWLYSRELAPCVEGDVLVDMSGISFSDERPGLGLLINALWLVPALGAGMPMIKISQAMGPFERLSTRTVSHFFLSRMRTLVARGEQSAWHMRELLPEREIFCLPDMAFALQPAGEADLAALKRAHSIPNVPFAVMGPSHVVDTFSAQAGVQGYVRYMADTALWLLNHTDLHLVLLPHEVKNSTEDDFAVCTAIRRLLPENGRVHLVPLIEDPRLSKALCAEAEIAVGSRFHFLVATLSSCVPSMSVAWSHKYAEMMQMVGQQDVVVRYEEANSEGMLRLVERVWAQRRERRQTLREKVPVVVDAARDNARLVASLLREPKGYL